jgi:hypothetical protein
MGGSVIKTLQSFEVAGKRVFLRCDLNVPLKDGEITDDGRIRASLPTIKTLIANGASLVIAAHLGRPKGEAKPELSLAPVAARLSELLGQPVAFAGAVTGSDVTSKAQALKSGEILLLENIRFSAAETSKEESERANFAKELSQLADFYVGDGFGAVHRKHASVFDLPKLLPHVAGTLVAAEVEVLNRNPGLEPTITLSHLNEVASNLAYLQREVRLTGAAGPIQGPIYEFVQPVNVVGGSLEGFENMNGETQTGQIATPKELENFIARLSAEILRLAASGTTDPIINARITNLTNLKNDVDGVLTKIQSGAILSNEIPIQ